MHHLLGCFRKTLRQCCGKLSKGVLFHQANVPGCINEYGFELIQHPPYTTNLVPSDCFQRRPFPVLI